MKRFLLFFSAVILPLSCRTYYIPAGSMMNTLHVGDHIFSTISLSYAPRRGDLLIFRPPNEEDKDYIKRCIAIPGDRVEIREDAVFLNGKRLEEPYALGPTRYILFSGDTRRLDGVVPAGKLVLLGDNRENSLDSRYFGYVDIKCVKGRAFFLYWNSDDFRKGRCSRWGVIK